MISLYIHIPFCASKCAYCSFNSLPIDSSDGLIDQYIEAMKKEIDHYSETLTDKSLKTLYFWWGTPSRIWILRIIDIIEYIRTKFNFEELAELSIELNPYPEDEVLDFVRTLNKKYDKVSRLRYSFGIQSFDDEILQRTWRAYSFWSIVEFLRSLVKLRKENNVFNFDFIAFGKFQISKNGFKQLRHEFKREFLKKFLDSWYVDSISLYTLEGIKDKDKSSREIQQISHSLSQAPNPPSSYYGTDEEIMEEFGILKKIIENAGFWRYEISNFAKAGKASIHNMVYWNMENYLWIGLSASSFFHTQDSNNLSGIRNQESKIDIPNKLIPNKPLTSGIRRTNTWDIKQYLEWNRVNEKEVQILNESDLLIEEFFLRLRTREGITDISKFIPLLVSNYDSLIMSYKKEELVDFDGKRLQLTDAWMDVSNSIITDLLQKL